MNSIFSLVDELVKERVYEGYENDDHEFVLFDRAGALVLWCRIPALEAKVAEWSKEHPLIWNSGIGASASFVRTLSRLLFERSEDLYGPYNHIIRVSLAPYAAVGSSAAQHWLAFEVFMEMAKAGKIPRLPQKELEELKKQAAEESYFGYGTICENLMLKVFGLDYVILTLGSDYSSVETDPSYYHQPFESPIVKGMRKAFQSGRHLLLVENVHVPLSLDVLVFTTDKHPSPFQSRWLISTTSKDVCDKSRETPGTYRWELHSGKEYNYAPRFDDDLSENDWAMLIKEALLDAAASIHIALQQQQQDMLFWLYIAHQCLRYSILYHPLRGDTDCPVTSDEHVRCWVVEDLLFSEANGKKHSISYRPAFEVGKVVIQALQKYSLLPTSSTSPLDAVTGVSKLAEGVPRLNQDELSHHDKRERLSLVSFFNNDGRHLSWGLGRDEGAKLIPGEMVMSTLILRGCSNASAFPFDTVSNHSLRVLDLSYTQINSLPSWLSNLLNLHLLSLRGCSQLETLSPPALVSEEERSPLANLGNLQVLDMNGVPLLELTQQDGSNKSNLHFLDLSGSKVITLPSGFFCDMSSLEELILNNCSNLKKLPPSLADLSNLLILHVEGTQITSFPEDTFQAMQRLHTLKLIKNMLLKSLPSSLSRAKGLRELHIHNCITLKTDTLWDLVSCLEGLYIRAWEALEDLKIHGHHNLRTFSLSGPWIRCLSLRGCSRLEIVNFRDDLTALEDVDLSGTAIEDIPQNLPNLPQLRRLLLLNVPSFKRFPWHQLIRFPKVFYLDNCEYYGNQSPKILCEQKICEEGSQDREKTTNTAQINTNDPRMFHSFSAFAANKLVKEGQFLQCFNVQVKGCSVRGMEPKNKEGEICSKIQRQLPYQDVAHSSEVASIAPMVRLQPKQRHLEISSNDRYPDGLRHILSVTESLFITDDASIKCLNESNCTMTCLEECQLVQCHEMKVVFKMHSRVTGAIRREYLEIRIPEVLPALKIFQASNLQNLLSFVEPGDLSYSALITLKLLNHIHLEHCPRLEKLFPCSLSLPSLETLVILFCYNLKTIFYNQSDYDVAASPLPNIERIYLQELPQLQHFHDDVMFRFETLKWEKLFVRGCQSFHRLPLLKSEYPESRVEVSGERDWWGRLQWSLPEQSHYYLHVPPPEFASRKKHIIRSYLR
ncbi:hypothetical protein SEVIR_8G075600v4 [Setaria viridis]|uniref:Disease resistance R13L4/SHOC-2-like LRR domain-containing protein n=1 Tax=Setaria viridis TaxID=4556 RepID=A0A4U6TCV1_SETVI|nr:uncharacterized protein LOC117866546 isoform X1 [Setaria viridis]XP_034606673.1 uncharacterized protein LOC117866546 isoform X1 [Setaria viridis]XP_034606674.1 uncharacterized protein LOC117866546 isoform X1 [Setaria viridis]TKV99917.1 hypothetical protein SEVIR_8G075600v2 [Setaria viridis]